MSDPVIGEPIYYPHWSDDKQKWVIEKMEVYGMEPKLVALKLVYDATYYIMVPDTEVYRDYDEAEQAVVGLILRRIAGVASSW